MPGWPEETASKNQLVISNVDHLGHACHYTRKYRD